MTPHMSITAMYSDYVLPVADHYEREDFTMEGRTPYVHAIAEAVPPLGESKDDWGVFEAMAAAISNRAQERGMAPVKGFAFGQPVEWDYTKFHEIFTTLALADGSTKKVTRTRDAVDFIISNSAGISNVRNYEHLTEKGFVRSDDSDDVQFGKKSNFSYQILSSVIDKKPYHTLTGRQQFYIDHDWFMEEGEALPAYRAPVAIEGYPLRMVMGHVRHGIHSMWRDDSLMLSLQRGEPDIYVNPDDAAQRGVEDGDLIRMFNSFGSFEVIAHVSSMVQPGMTFMYHGWDPMMFRGRQNFGAVIASGGLIKPTSLVGGYGHITFRSFYYEPNATFQDVTCDFERYEAA
jgi:nitrate reductase alpha subunit